MKTIPQTFKRWGDDWRIVERKGDVALLLQAGRNWNVTIVQRSKPREIDGKVIGGDDSEYLPGATAYGRLAWNYGIAQDRARAKFAAMTGGVSA